MRPRWARAARAAAVILVAGAASDCQQILGLEAGAPAHSTASVATTAVAFGLVDCGAATPTMQTVSVENTGAAPLHVTASLGAPSAFSIRSGASSTIAPGASGAVVVAVSVPSTNAAGSMLSATLTLATDDPAKANVTIPLTATAQGGTISLSTPLASFGTVLVGMKAPTIPLTLSNAGNAPVDVSLGTPTDPDFSATYTGAPKPASLAPNTALQGLGVNFTPTDILMHEASIPIVVGGAVCGLGASSIPVAGQGTNGAFTSSTSDLYFGPNMDGNVPCGTTATPRSLKIGNAGNLAYSWTASLMGTGFSVMPASGIVPANQMVTLTVTPLVGIPTTSPVTAELYSDKLTITTDAANDTPHVVDLHQTAYGAILAFDPTPTLDFGSVPANQTEMKTLTVNNTGNGPANVTLAAGVPFGIMPVGPTLVAGGASLPAMASFDPGTSIALQTSVATVAVAMTDVLCQPLPAGDSLTGTGLDGVVGFGPTSLDFGTVDCGKSGAFQVVTFTNSGNSDYSITPSLGKGMTSPYQLVMSPANGLVAHGGGMATITVTPTAIPSTSAITPNLYGDLLTVTTTVAGDAPHYIPITETAGGAIFTFETASIDFGAVPSGAGAKFSFAVNNIGNEDVILQATGTAGTPFQVQTSGDCYPGASSWDLLFNPTGAGLEKTTVTLAPVTAQGHVLCQPLPSATIALQGTATASNACTLMGADVEFVPQDCNSQGASLGFTVVIHNPAMLPGAANVTLSAGSPFAVNPPAFGIGPVPSQNVPIQVIAPVIPQVSSTLRHFFSDVAVITTNLAGIGNVPCHAFLHATAQGAALSFNETAAVFPDTTAGSATTANGSFFVSNTGNVPFSAAVKLSDTTDFSAAPASQVQLIPFVPRLFVMSFTPMAAGMKSSTATLLPQMPEGPLCAALPPEISFSGLAQ